MDLKIKYVIKDVDRYGKVRWYYRAPGCKKVALPAPDDPTFVEALALAKAQAKPVDPTEGVDSSSLKWLCLSYMDSQDFKREIGKSTQAVRKRILDRLCAKHGTKPYKLLGSQHVLKLRDEWASEGPEAGNSVVKALRQVYKWAIAAKHTNTNPARDVEYLSSDNPDGFHTWTEDEVSAYIARHPIGTKAYLALHLLMFGGGRLSDAVRLGKQMVKDGCFHYIEWKGRGKKKTRKERSVPIIPVLQEAINSCPTGEMIYLTNAYNKPFASAKAFGNWFKDRCIEAGLDHCSAHGLRKAAAVMAAESGCTEHELMSLFGWTTTKQPLVYTRKVNEHKLAQSGSAKIVQLMSLKKSNSEKAEGNQ